MTKIVINVYVFNYAFFSYLAVGMTMSLIKQQSINIKRLRTGLLTLLLLFLSLVSKWILHVHIQCRQTNTKRA